MRQHRQAALLVLGQCRVEGLGRVDDLVQRLAARGIGVRHAAEPLDRIGGPRLPARLLAQRRQLAHAIVQGLLDRRTDGFSQGEKMKTALARALVHDPANIVLDEPTNGLDVLATRALRDTLRHLQSPAGGNKCILFSTHIMQEVERLCDAVVIVAAGRDVARGTVAELIAQAGAADFEEAFVRLAFPAVPA